MMNGNENENETKKCKYCQSDIDKKAKVCPVCKKKLVHPVRNTVLVIIAVLIVISVATSGNNKTVPTSATSSNSTSSQQESKTYNIGDTISTDSYSITISKVEEKSRVGSEYLYKDADSGNTFICYQVSYKNTTSKPISSFSQPSFKLVDQNGTEYGTDIGISSYYQTEVGDDSKVLSDINPGVTVKDAGAFEMGKDVYSNGTWTLKITAGSQTLNVKVK